MILLMRYLRLKLYNIVFVCALLTLYTVWINVTAEKERSQCKGHDRRYDKLPVHGGSKDKPDDSLPWIYMVTPTYPRLEQIPDLTRLAQTLQTIPNLHWILVEDSNGAKNPSVETLLEDKGLSFTYIVKKMPFILGKEALSRITGYEWVRDNVKQGVMYYGDDDNTYDSRIFEEMRDIKKVGMWPVGLVTKYGISTPVCRAGKVVGFYDGFDGGRKFRIDMAAFAVNIEYMLKQPSIEMNITIGYQETSFLESLNIGLEDIETKAEDCTKIWVWHTQTVKEELAYLLRYPDDNEIQDTNLKKLKEHTVNSNDMIEQTVLNARLMKQQWRDLWKRMGPEKDPRKKKRGQ